MMIKLDISPRLVHVGDRTIDGEIERDGDEAIWYDETQLSEVKGADLTAGGLVRLGFGRGADPFGVAWIFPPYGERLSVECPHDEPDDEEAEG